MFDENDIIYSYSSKQAEEDGILFDITHINRTWKKGLFNYITMNLLNKGYIKEETINVANLIDLLNQAVLIVRNKSKNYTELDYFYDGKIELPNGEKTVIYIEQNETGKYTIMLPEDR
jgi:hypothetical protein